MLFTNVPNAATIMNTATNMQYLLQVDMHVCVCALLGHMCNVGI